MCICTKANPLFSLCVRFRSLALALRLLHFALDSHNPNGMFASLGLRGLCYGQVATNEISFHERVGPMSYGP